MNNAIKTTIQESPVTTYDSGNRGEIQDSIKAGNKSIQLKQVVTKISHYPTRVVNNNLTEISFGQEVNDTNDYHSSETRVTWVEVSADKWKALGLTGKELDVKILADFEAYLASKPKARIYKTLSTEPILSEGQKRGIEAGLTTLEAIAEKQLVRYGNGDNQGEPILWNGLKQYKVLAFSENGKADVDLRKVEVFIGSNPVDIEVLQEEALEY